MAIQTYEVALGPDYYTFTAINNVQDISVNIGRKSQLDQYNASTASITLRYPNGYTSPDANIKTGYFVRIRNITSGKNIFYGVINNATVNYGIPYAGGVGNADYVEISCESTFAQLGRMQGNNYAMAAGDIFSQRDAATSNTGISFPVAGGINKALGATTVSGTWADWLNRLLLTTNSRMIDAGAQSIQILSPFYYKAPNFNFSDTTNNATNQVYDQINFDSLADNYYTQVIVSPEGYAAQTVTKSGATTPYRTLQTNTINASTSQALDFANYLLGNYNTQSLALSSISAKAESQNDFKLDAIENFLGGSVGTSVSVAFRGANYPCVIEGVSLSATPEGSRYTYYLSGADLNAYLLLDNAVYGILGGTGIIYNTPMDYNEAGYIYNDNYADNGNRLGY